MFLICRPFSVLFVVTWWYVFWGVHGVEGVLETVQWVLITPPLGEITWGAYEVRAHRGP